MMNLSTTRPTMSVDRPAERDDRIQAVAELRREGAVDGIGILADPLLPLETDGVFFAMIGRAGIGRHDQDDVAEIDRLAIVVGQLAVIHDLQQDVEQVGMRLLDLVQQQHLVRVLVDGVGQQATLVEADIARRRADQTG